MRSISMRIALYVPLTPSSLVAFSRTVVSTIPRFEQPLR